ncbi:ElyC/SanA/YdcF family protein [Citricoccus sp. NR2]|uniref:ElyC/SanA/YdcF family protein n=1 Tax=Citricoccus sp. NR2 TaxID=3004095 RepID=UPI0022DD9591|nr:ElyC/SanA/YdcF family protein [Citricoccus sp. NR2]WBL19227.1 YdcF family protein [Citricoccus sp. NR2]
MTTWVVLGARYILLASPDEPAPVDAVYALGVVSPERLDRAVDLIEAGHSDHLVMTVSSEAHWGEFCRREHGFTVTCVTPDPLTTRGEARSWARLAEQHDWDSVMVITMVPHLGRAEMYFQRCFSGELVMVDDGRDMESAVWVRQLFYESAAFVRYALSRGC